MVIIYSYFSLLHCQLSKNLSHTKHRCCNSLSTSLYEKSQNIAHVLSEPQLNLFYMICMSHFWLLIEGANGETLILRWRLCNIPSHAHMSKTLLCGIVGTRCFISLNQLFYLQIHLSLTTLILTELNNFTISPYFSLQFISYLRKFSASWVLSIITAVDSFRESLHQKLNAWRALALLMHPSPYFS